jgi:tungstate transport system ATP-binding protein
LTAAYRLERVRFDYGKGTVLDLESLTIQSRQVTALVGPNGAGKSTLISLLAFLEAATAGTLEYFGVPVSKSNFPGLRKTVGMVPQTPFFLNGSIAYNVELGLKIRGISRRQREKQVRTALAMVDIDRHSERGIESLSGGERQRVALARALALDPTVLLFDEPFTYLDSLAIRITEKLISWFVEEKGGTVVLSTHNRLHGVAISDQVVNLLHGTIAEVPLINLFHGKYRDGVFNTGQIEVEVPEATENARYIAIHPNEIVLSLHPLDSSMRNCFQGRVMTITECKHQIQVQVVGKERFEVLITRESLDQLEIEIGLSLWVNFKSTSISVLDQ